MCVLHRILSTFPLLAVQLPITALVVARGSIQSSQRFSSSSGPITTFQVQVTPQLADRFCVVAYYVKRCSDGQYHVISDIACVETDKRCANEVQNIGL